MWGLPGDGSALFSRPTDVFGVRSASSSGLTHPAGECALGTCISTSSSSGDPTRAARKGFSMDTEFGRPGSTAVGTDQQTGIRRLSTETKAAYKTTEFLTHVGGGGV